jgi:hypothetical protein
MDGFCWGIAALEKYNERLKMINHKCTKDKKVQKIDCLIGNI